MPKPIATAPKDGRKVMVQWRDREGVENTSIAQYRSGSDPADTGWWIFIDGDTQKRVEPHSWSSADEDEDDR